MIAVAILGFTMVISAAYVRRARGEKLSGFMLLAIALAILSLVGAIGQLLARENPYWALMLSYFAAISLVLALAIDPLLCSDIVIVILHKWIPPRVAISPTPQSSVPKFIVVVFRIMRIVLLLIGLEIGVLMWLVQGTAHPSR